VDYASCDKVGKHRVVDDPEASDLIAFIGSARHNFDDIRDHHLYKRYKAKSVIYYSGDRSIPLLPGVYTCLENRCFTRLRKSIESGYYLRVTDSEYLDTTKLAGEAKFLFAFMGNANYHPVRKEICALPGDRAFLKNSAADSAQTPDQLRGMNPDPKLLYRDVLEASKFFLCPRGIGVSTWRIFETMRAGRVPVVISDLWVPPVGPNWNSFALFIKEADVRRIPAILERNENRAEEMGALARNEWEHYYSKERVFTTVIDQFERAQPSFCDESPLRRSLTYLQYLSPFFLRHWLLSPIKAHLTCSRKD